MKEPTMNLKHTFVMTWCLLLASGLWTACNDDTQSLLPPAEPEEEQPILGEGQFLVSYGTTASAGRALSDVPLPTAKRISSLHYFVYDSVTGNLVKKRQIRDINENTHWPIGNRADMSWELRQDLQDTLMEGPTYRILFIANVDPALFVKADGKPHPEIVRDVQTYGSAKILLPEVPFSDNNMYYLWEGSLKDTAGATVKRADVKLQRLVTRTDVSRMEIADMDKHLYNAIAESAYAKMEKSIKTNMRSHIDAFCTRMIDNMKGTNANNAAELAKFLRTETTLNILADAFKQKVIEDYVKAIQGSNVVDQCADWSAVNSVTVTYQKNSRANALTFDRKAIKVGNLAQVEKLEVSNGHFTIIGFSGDENTELNGIEQLDFKGTVQESDFTVKNTTLWLKGGLNTRYLAICNPAKSIEFTTTNSTNANSYLNFNEALKDNNEWKDFKGRKDFFYWIEQNVFDFVINSNEVYGKSFDNFWFNNVNLLNIQKDGVGKSVKLYPSWTVNSINLF